MERVLKVFSIVGVLLTGVLALLGSCDREPHESVSTKRALAPSVVAAVSQPSQPLDSIPEPPPGAADELRRLRNLGCAALDSDDFKTAIHYFEKCCALSSNEPSDLANLGMALYGDGQLEAAEQRLRQALAVDPLNPVILYHFGLTCKKLSRLEDARAAFARVTEIDPLDATSFYQLGSIQDQLGLSEEAERSFKKTIELEPIHASAYYRLMAIYRKQRRRDEMKQAMQAFQSLRETTPESNRTEKQLERGRHSGAIWPKHDQVGPPLSVPSQTRFVEVPFPLGNLVGGTDLVPGRIDLADIDRDTFMDLVISGQARSATETSPFVLRNLGDLQFERFPINWHAPEHYPAQDAQFGDFDRDGYRDLFLIGPGVTILRNVAGRDLVPAVGVGGLPTAGLYQRALLVDEDHDGDLDLFLVPVPTRSGARPLAELYRNNGSGQFAHITGAACVPESEGFVTGITILDADEDDDIDLLFATTRGLVLLTNQRQNKFVDFTN